MSGSLASFLNFVWYGQTYDSISARYNKKERAVDLFGHEHVSYDIRVWCGVIEGRAQKTRGRIEKGAAAR